MNLCHERMCRLFSVLMTAVLLTAGLLADSRVSQAEMPGGCLAARDDHGAELGGCPLEHTNVTVDISGFIARVTVTQRFGNPFATPIEAVYTFPLSERGAVDQMTMRIGDRLIRGLIKERGEARQIYEAARDRGQTASLLDQERPNIFTQSVANIMPGNPIEITLSYVEVLPYIYGEYQFVFPMTVEPRYIPGAATGPGGTTEVPDAGRITPPVTPEGTRTGHDIGLTVHLDAGIPIQDIQSELHKVAIDRAGSDKAIIRLANQQEIPNRDFILKYRVAGDDIQDAFMVHTDEKGGYFTLVIQPPRKVKPKYVTPKEMIFVIDCSGSMQGFPIEKAKSAMRGCIEGMNPNDTFNLVSFSGGMGYCFDRAVPNTPLNQQRALDYLAKLEGGGGTEMMPAIQAALGGQYEHGRLRVVCFMTDGCIGNDMAILDAIQANVRTARVFSFGIGNSVNRFLLEGMARTGRGAAEIITLEGDSDKAVQRFRDRVQNPLLTDLRIDFGGLAVEDVYPDPNALPDLFSAQPVVLTGRFVRDGHGEITLQGQQANGPFERKISVVLPKTAPEHQVLAPLWARARVDWLMEQDWLGCQNGAINTGIKGEVTKLGLDYGLLTQYTSFVAVEDRVVNENGKPVTVQVPVEMADGVSYEGVFGTAQNKSKATRGSSPMPLGAPMPSLPAKDQFRSSSMALDSREEVSAAVAAPAPLPSLKPEPKAEVDGDVNTASLSKLDPGLQGLAARVVNGQFDDGKVRVKDGWVEVIIYLDVNAIDAALKVLGENGVKLGAITRYSGRALAEIRVEDLEKIAGLAEVIKITPRTV